MRKPAKAGFFIVLAKKNKHYSSAYAIHFYKFTKSP